MTAARTLRALRSALVAAVLITGCSGGDDAAPEAAATLSGAASTSEPSATSSDEAAEGTDAAPDTAEATDSAAEPDAQDAGLGAAVGEVVEGFPLDLIALYPGAEVALSSATPSGDEMDVTLAGRSGDAPEAVVEFYRQRLLAAGFAESGGGGAAGALSATFTRTGGAEVLSVAVVSTSGVPPQQFTVGGTIAP